MKSSRSSSFSCAECMHCPAPPAHWAGIVQWLRSIASDQKWSKEFYSRALDTMLQHLASCSALAPWHSGDGGSLLMVNVNFLCGTQANLPPLFFAAEESLSSKIEFPNKRGGCGWWWARSWLAGAGLASLGNPWQRKRTILLSTSASLRTHDMGLG